MAFPFQKSGKLTIIGASMSASFALTAASGTLIAGILVNAQNMFAPAAVKFAADATLQQKETLHFKWQFDDPGTFARLDPNRASGRDSNTEYGFSAAHTYNAGTFNPTLTVTDGTITQIFNIPIRVESASTRFARGNTIVVDPTGAYPNKPPGAQQVRTAAAGLAALEANGGGRLLFYTGHRHTLTSDIQLNGRKLAGESAKNQVLFGAIGTGPRPIIDNSRGAFHTWKIANSESQIVFTGLDFRGGYESSVGAGARAGLASVRVNSERGNYLVHDCTASGVSSAIETIQKFPDRYVAVSDCDFTNWENYGVFHSDGELAIYGTAIQQAVTAVNGDGAKPVGKNPNWADHGPLRVELARFVFLGKNDMSSCTGWSAAGGKTAHQPAFRALQQSTGKGLQYQIDAQYNIQNCVFEGGWKVISITPHSEGMEVAPFLVCVFEHNHFQGTANTQSMIRCHSGGITFRNNVCVMPDVPAEILIGFEGFLDAFIRNRPQTNGNQRARRIFVNNTFVDLRSTANQPDDAVVYEDAEWAKTNGWFGYVVANNIHHAPNRSAPIASSAPLNSTGTFAARYNGERWLSSKPKTNFDSSGTAFTGTYQPLAGSPALGAASGQVALDDFTGALRGSAPSKGAFQRAASL